MTAFVRADDVNAGVTGRPSYQPRPKEAKVGTKSLSIKSEGILVHAQE